MKLIGNNLKLRFAIMALAFGLFCPPVALAQIGVEKDTTAYKVTGGVNAFDYRLQKPLGNELFPNKKIGDHLFFGIEGGVTLTHRSNGQFVGQQDVGFRAGGSVGDWFTPVHGGKIGINGGMRNEYLIERYGYFGVSLDYMMNLTALLKGYDPLRKYDIVGVAGAEYQHRLRTPDKYHAFGAHFGLQARWNVLENTYFYIEPRINIFTDRVNRRRTWQRYDWEAAILMGLGYNLRPGHKHFATTLDNKGLFDNTFYGFSAGVNLDIRHDIHTFHDLGRHMSGQGSMYVGKMTSTVSGWRAMATFGLLQQGRSYHDGAQFCISTAEIDYMLNVNSAISGFNPENRFNTNVIAGPVIGLTSGERHKANLGASVALQGVYDINKNLQLVVEPKMLIFSHKFLNKGGKTSLIGSLNVGFQYRLGSFTDDLVKYDYSTALPEFNASDKMFVSIAGGPIGRYSKWHKSAGASLSVGRWLSPVSAWRLSLNADYFDPSIRYADVTLGADYMLSLGTMFLGYDPQRKFDLVGSVGAHFGCGYYEGGKKPKVYGIQAAMQARWSASPSIDLFLEPQYRTTHSLGHIYNFGRHWRILLGVTYKMGNHYKTASDPQPEDFDRKNYITVEGGPGMFSEALSNFPVRFIDGGLDVAYGRRINYFSAVQAGLGFDFVKPTEKPLALVSVQTAHADYLCDFTQLLDYDPGRRFHIEGLFGLGVGWSNYVDSKPSFAWQIGGRARYSLTDRFDLLAEERLTVWRPAILNFGYNRHSFVGSAKFMVGASLKF